MKSLLLIPILALPLLLTSCAPVVVDRYPRRGAYVERDVVETYPRRGGYYGRDVVVDRYPRRDPYYYDRNVVVEERRPRRDVVVVNPAYRPRVEVRYYSDYRGRYYIKDGRRIYVNAGVHY